MSQFEAFVGKTSVPVENEVEKGAIRKFAQAIGDSNPLYFDEPYAKACGYTSTVAPPTFSRTFDYGIVEGFELPRDGLIHGGQEFEYHRPIVAGDVLFCSTRLTKVFERSGKLGKMTFLVFEHLTHDSSDCLVVKETSTVIYREG